LREEKGVHKYGLVDKDKVRGIKRRITNVRYYVERASGGYPQEILAHPSPPGYQLSNRPRQRLAFPEQITQIIKSDKAIPEAASYSQADI